MHTNKAEREKKMEIKTTQEIWKIAYNGCTSKEEKKKWVLVEDLIKLSDENLNWEVYILRKKEEQEEKNYKKRNKNDM